MVRLALPTPNRLAITLSLILTLAVVMPQPAWGKHQRPKARISTAGFVAASPDPTVSVTPTGFECTWVEDPLHGYRCTPSPTILTNSPTPNPDSWPNPFQLKHALIAAGNPPPEPPPGEWWGGLAHPDLAEHFSCAWDGTPFDTPPPPPAQQLPDDYRCSYRNPQLHVFTVADIVSVCEDDTEALDCLLPPPTAYPDWSGEPNANVDTWYLPDTIPPNTSVVAGPSGRVAPKDVILRFASSENGSTFACRLDGGSREECAASQTYPDLDDGRHSLEVQATDAASNVDSTPAARTWEVDGTAPDTRLRRGPRKTTRDRTPRFRFAASEPMATFACRLDARPFTRCRSPSVVKPLADGRHAFLVRASDSVGNSDASPARRAFTVDTTGPRLRISRRTLQLLRGGLAIVRVRCSKAELTGPCAGRLTLKTAERVNVGAGRRTVTLGKSRVRLRRGRRGLVEIELTRQGRNLVAQLNRVRIRAVARMKDRVGNVATTRRRLAIEAP